MKAIFPVLALAVLATGSRPVERATSPAYKAEIEAWRGARETRLRAADGWLALAGLFWLGPGANTLGSGPGNDIVLPAGVAPDRAGVIDLQGTQAPLRLEAGVAASIKGRLVTATALRSDHDGEPDVLSLGRLSLYGIERSGRLGVRV